LAQAEAEARRCGLEIREIGIRLRLLALEGCHCDRAEKTARKAAFFTQKPPAELCNRLVAVRRQL